MCKYYGYVRVSTETQAEKGYGLEAQRIEIERYAKVNGYQIANVFSDEGISGNIKDTDDDDAINKRKGLIAMLAAVEPGDVIIVLNTSRLWRSDMTKAIVRRELMRKQAQVYSIQQPNYKVDNKDPNDYLINAIMEALDVYERMSIALKLAKGRTVKAAHGDKPAGVLPYGYQYSADRKHVEVNDAEAVIVRKMFSMAQAGASLGKIADEVTAMGVTTRRGKTFPRGSVAAILNNRFYVGELRHAGQIIQGNHTAIISKVQYGKVQAQMARHTKKTEGC